MFRFFRALRQRLLTENRFSKYMLYAVGEILLVVIGILIALQVNNANETSKLKADIRGAYQAILGNLKEDRAMYDTLLLVYEKDNSERSRRVLEILTRETTRNDLLELRGMRPGSFNLDYINVAYNAFVASGLIYKAENAPLNEALAEYYREQEDVEDFFRRLFDTSTQMQTREAMIPFHFIIAGGDPGGDFHWMNDPSHPSYQALYAFQHSILSMNERRVFRIAGLARMNDSLQLKLEKYLAP